MAAVMEGIDTVLFDCDGVLWSGEHVFAFTAPVLIALHAGGRAVRFLTNNSTRTRASFVAKFHALGVGFVREEHVVSSSYVTARYVARHALVPADGAAFVVGEAGVGAELAAQGVRWVGGDAVAPDQSVETLLAAARAAGAAVVVMGIDRHISYPKLAAAALLLTQEPRCAFLATNADATFPSHLGILPGSGSLIQALVTATGRSPTLLGKPNQPFMDAVLEELGPDLPRERVLMVGDRLDTDIEFGNRAGTRTLLVLTGVTTAEDAAAVPEGDLRRPHHVAASIEALLAPPGAAVGGERA